MTEDLFEFAAEQAKRAGIAQVEEHDDQGARWIDRAIDLLPDYPASEATGEDLRLWLEPRIGLPHHPNCAGAMVRRARKMGLLAPTGRYRRPRSVASHSRPIEVYRMNVKLSDQ